MICEHVGCAIDHEAALQHRAEASMRRAARAELAVWLDIATTDLRAARKAAESRPIDVAPWVAKVDLLSAALRTVTALAGVSGRQRIRAGVTA